MKVAVLSDVYGNSVALAAVLSELEAENVQMRRTEYELDEALKRFRARDFPDVEELVEMMVEPPEPPEVIEHGEKAVFSG